MLTVTRLLFRRFPAFPDDHSIRSAQVGHGINYSTLSGQNSNRERERERECKQTGKPKQSSVSTITSAVNVCSNLSRVVV